MFKDMTIGQYFEGNSLLHKADPRVKILLSILFIVGVFSAQGVYAFAFCTLVGIALIFVSALPLKMILKSIRPLVYIIVFTSVINIFWTSGETLLLEFGVIKIYAEGLVAAGLIALRIILLIVGASVILTYTTSPIMLTDGIEQLLSPLKKIKVPVHEFAMMMTIALRFIPTLVEETAKIMDAQKARGANFEGGSLTSRAKALIPVLVPLFVSAFKRADDLAVAMECRCYRGGDGRTRMEVLRMSAGDWLWLALGVAFIGAVIAVNVFLPSRGI